jgi:transposase
MVTIGIDAHKHTHTVVIVDNQGQQLAAKTVGTTTADHLALLSWAKKYDEQLAWAVEDCRHLSRRLERDLLAAGQRIVRVPPKLMANMRDAARTFGKSDPIDALAVARAALREPDLPAACLDGPEREVRLLVDHREDLVAERTRIISRLRWHLHELDRGWQPTARSLDRPRALNQTAARLEGADRHRGAARSRAPRALPQAQRRNQAARSRDHRARRTARALTARDPRLRPAHGGEDPRRDRRRRTLPLE